MLYARQAVLGVVRTGKIGIRQCQVGILSISTHAIKSVLCRRTSWGDTLSSAMQKQNSRHPPVLAKPFPPGSKSQVSTDPFVYIIYGPDPLSPDFKLPNGATPASRKQVSTIERCFRNRAPDPLSPDFKQPNLLEMNQSRHRSS